MINNYFGEQQNIFRVSAGQNPQADEMNLYFQQSFNKMFNDLLGGNDTDESDDFFSSSAMLPMNSGNQFLDSSTNNALSQNPFDQSLFSPSFNNTMYQDNWFQSLVNKEINYQVPETGERKKGIVERVIIDNQGTFAVIDGVRINMNDII